VIISRAPYVSPFDAGVFLSKFISAAFFHPPFARPTRNATYDPNETNVTTLKGKRFTKWDDGIIKVDESDVTGISVPFL